MNDSNEAELLQADPAAAAKPEAGRDNVALQEPVEVSQPALGWFQ